MMNRLQVIFLKLIGVAVFLFLSVATIIGVLLSLLVRPLVAVLATICRPDLAGLMHDRGQPLALESVQTESGFTVVMHLVCDGTISLDALREQFHHQLMPSILNKNKSDTYIHLRQLWTQYLGYLFWQWESDFRVENHIREYDYDEPELAIPQGVCSEEDLKRATAGIVAKPFAEGRSPWEILVIDKYRSNNNTDGHPQCVIVLRIHHALADGISIIKMLLRLFDQEATPFATARFPQNSFATRVRRNLMVALTAPFVMASTLVDAYDGKNSWYIENKRLPKQYHTFFSDSVPVAKIKEIMRKHQVCYNAVVYSVTIGAMVKLMEEVGQQVSAQASCSYAYPLPKHPGGLVNHATLDLFTIKPLVHSSPGQRLRVISSSVLPVSAFPSLPAINNWIISLLILLPAKFGGLMFTFLNNSLGTTNFPGPDAELDIMGNARLVEIIPAIGHPRSSVGALAIMVSSGGKQRIVLTVQRVNLEGYEVPCGFARYIEEEIRQLLEEPSTCRVKTESQP